MKELTYLRLDKILRSLGFASHPLDGNGRGYQHAATGARVTLPTMQNNEKVLPHHMVAVRAILNAFAIPEPDEFADELTRVG